MPKMLIICTQAWHGIKLVAKRCRYGQSQFYVSTSSLLMKTAVSSRPDWLTQSSTRPQRVCRLLSRGAEEQCISYLTCVLSLPLQTHTHTHTVMNEQTCVPTRLCKVHCKRLTHKEQECYIFITDVIDTECPKLFWGVLIAQQKGPIRSINQWPHWVTGIWVKRHKNTETADWAAQQTVKSAYSSLKLH